LIGELGTDFRAGESWRDRIAAVGDWWKDDPIEDLFLFGVLNDICAVGGCCKKKWTWWERVGKADGSRVVVKGIHNPKRTKDETRLIAGRLLYVSRVYFVVNGLVRVYGVLGVPCDVAVVAVDSWRKAACFVSLFECCMGDEK
jgi:hypothetical protein